MLIFNFPSRLRHVQKLWNFFQTKFLFNPFQVTLGMVFIHSCFYHGNMKIHPWSPLIYQYIFQNLNITLTLIKLSNLMLVHNFRKLTLLFL